MDFTVGSIVDGKVKSITKFGAFVSLPGGRTGMVHISEIAHAYVSDIHEYLTEGQEVKVMILSVDQVGKINLSIKRTLESPKHPDNRFQNREHSASSDRPRPQENRRCPASSQPQSFDDMVKQFLADSDSKISSIKQYSDHRSKTRRR